MKDKKGVEMSMNLIIIAAIALLVLVILAILVLRSGNNAANASSCTQHGGDCNTPLTGICPSGYITYVASCPADYKCCIPNPITN